MTSVGSIVSGAFGVVLRHPLAVLVWGLIYMALIFATFWLMWPIVEAILSASMKGNEEAALRELERGQLNSGMMSIMQIGAYVVPAIVMTAAMRTVLRPEQTGVFFLRIGMDEVRVGAVWFVMNIALGIGMVVAMIPLGIVVAIAAASGGEAAMILLIPFLVVVVVCAYFYFLVRVSLIAPVSFLRQEFAFSEGWRLTKGRFWTLFGGYFVVGMVHSLVWAVAISALLWPLIADLASANFEPARIQSAIEAFARRQVQPDATVVVGWVAMALASGIGVALYGGAAATAARDLTDDARTAGQTFA